MPEIDLTAGAIEYTDAGGRGPVMVFLHGPVMDGTVFDKVITELGASSSSSGLIRAGRKTACAVS